MMKLVVFGTLLFSLNTFSQTGAAPMEDVDVDEDVTLGGDIFSDFNEELEASQVLEDERFYRYGRFFSANFGLGTTSFTGNRGAAYKPNPPTYHVSVVYFFNFQVAFTMGIEYSKHTMLVDTYVQGYQNFLLGAVETSMLRTFWGMRYYIDTSDLGTAFTYSNPYFITRFEYWYQSNKFVEQPTVQPQANGAVGAAFGFGFEFPIEVKSSYIGLEFLYHQVNFFDKNTQDYRKIPTGSYGYDDLSGNVYSTVLSYNLTW